MFMSATTVGRDDVVEASRSESWVGRGEMWLKEGRRLHEDTNTIDA